MIELRSRLEQELRQLRGALTDLAATPGTTIKLLDHADAIPKLVQKYGPLYVKGTIPAKSYPGQTKDARGWPCGAMRVFSKAMRS